MENIKEIAKKDILEVIEKSYNDYKLPPNYVTEKDIDLFLYVLESYFLVHQMMDNYINAVNIIIRRALFFAALDKDKFDINHISRALQDLIAFNIPSDEIKVMQEELNQRVKKYKKI